MTQVASRHSISFPPARDNTSPWFRWETISKESLKPDWCWRYCEVPCPKSSIDSHQPSAEAAKSRDREPTATVEPMICDYIVYTDIPYWQYARRFRGPPSRNLFPHTVTSIRNAGVKICTSHNCTLRPLSGAGRFMPHLSAYLCTFYPPNLGTSIRSAGLLIVILFTSVSRHNLLTIYISSD